ETARRIRLALDLSGLEVLAIEHRIKNVGAIVRKMREKDIRFEMVQDVYAFRIIVLDESSCYAALGALHGAFRPSLLRFKDYIRHPKPNGYQSIHTTVNDDSDAPFELQIRTSDMHERSLSGRAAHWKYKSSPLTGADALALHLGVDIQPPVSLSSGLLPADEPAQPKTR
ncbi:MAG: hypothetical protein JRG91_11145, partial [Deltaproteobacteria bacterium]|nr:hypothetical protein [Deltaproteobacteria bacterium]